MDNSTSTQINLQVTLDPATLHNSPHAPGKDQQSHTNKTQSSKLVIEFVAKSVNPIHVLNEVLIDSLPFSGKFLCYEVGVFPDLIRKLPKEISLHVLTDAKKPAKQDQDLFGMIISVPKATDLDRDVSLLVRNSIGSMLRSNIATALKVLVLYQVIINEELITLMSLLKLRTLYLHCVSFDKKEDPHNNIDLYQILSLSFNKVKPNSYSVCLPETLEGFHLIHEQKATDAISFILPGD